MRATEVFKRSIPRFITITATILTAFMAVSCDKEHEFVGVWRATQTKNQQFFIHQFTFRKDHTATYCIEMPYLFQTECIEGAFEVAEKGQAVAWMGEKTPRSFTFTKNKKEIYCTELDMAFGFAYK